MSKHKSTSHGAAWKHFKKKQAGTVYSHQETFCAGFTEGLRAIIEDLHECDFTELAEMYEKQFAEDLKVKK